MKHKWKSGDQAYLPVTLDDVIPNKDGYVLVYTREKSPQFVTLKELIPAPDSLTDLERRVVEAGIAEFQAREAYVAASSEHNETRWRALRSAVDVHCNAIRDLLAARAPKDPLTIATDALRSIASCETRTSGDVVDIARRAITALEAKEIK